MGSKGSWLKRLLALDVHLDVVLTGFAAIGQPLHPCFGKQREEGLPAVGAAVPAPALDGFNHFASERIRPAGRRSTHLRPFWLRGRVVATKSTTSAGQQ